MRSRLPCRSDAFTLVEIMIVLAIIGLLATLLIPSFIKVRQQSQGRRIVNDVRTIDAAINCWAMEVGVADGTPVDLAGAGQYAKTGAINPVDVLGNGYVFGSVGDSQVMIATATKSALAGVSIDWGAY